ncbi:MAG: amino acid adenylation domain-containing protein [Candidatus Aminicenantes bacterium]|jgi:amino acid adenylation domain-containing protein
MKADTIHLAEIITKHSLRSPGKVAIKYGEQSITYRELEKKSNQVANVLHRSAGGKGNQQVIIMLDRSPELVIAIIGTLKCGLIFVPVDPFLPTARIEKIVKESGSHWIITSKKYGEPPGKLTGLENRELLLMDTNDLENEPTEFTIIYNKYCYVYFTSGSTGIPKGVLGRQKSLVHFIDWEINRFGVDESFNISQFTSPSFDPYLRDIFVPLASGAACCIVHGDIFTAPRQLVKWIDQYQVTLIHMVPSYFKILIDEIDDNDCFKHLKYILLAGELLRGNDIRKFIRLFGDRIQLVNLYGPTETTLAKLFYMVKKTDAAKSIIPVGKAIDGAQAMVLQDNLKKCQVGNIGEVYIRTPYISSGYFNDKALTRKVFIRNPFTHSPHDVIYKTGDLGRILPDGNIELIGRIDDQVKIRGIRMQLGEIENLLLAHQDVRDAVVTARDEAHNEKYICAYVVLKQEVEISLLREYLLEHLPGYMIPSYFVRLDKIPLKVNGKTDKQALPTPKTNLHQYTAPGNPIEETLTRIWSEVLQLEKDKISINANFFQLGGHSLKATVLTAKIHRQLNCKIPLSHVFKYPTIRLLAHHINDTHQDLYTFPGPVEARDYYPVSSVQKRLYVLQQIYPQSTAYNIPVTAGLKGKLDIKRIYEIFKDLLTRHEALRTSFQLVGKEVFQKITPAGETSFEFGYEDLEGVMHHWEDEAEAAKEKMKDFLKPFDLSWAPLFRVKVIKTGKNNYLLLVDMHHIISDGTSIGLLIKEFMSLYKGEILAALAIQYKDYSVWEQSKSRREAIKKQENYWRREFPGEIPALDLPWDYPRSAAADFKGDRVEFALEKEAVIDLKALASAQGATLFMILLAILYVLLAKLGGNREMVIGTGVEGRRYEELRNIMGMFVNTLPLRNYIDGEKTFKEFLTEVKDRTLQAFENQDYPFEKIIERIMTTREVGHNPLFNVLFQLDNMENPAITLPGLHLTLYQYDRRDSKFHLRFLAAERDDSLVIKVEYVTGLFKKETIRQFTHHFKEIVACIRKDINIKPRNINLSPSLQEVGSHLLPEDYTNFKFEVL